MRQARLAVTLHCTTCGGKFTLAGVDSNLTYVCVRCDVPVSSPVQGGTQTISGSSRGGIRYLYARRNRSGGHSWRRPFGRYTLHDEIGRGGMGVVYRAWDGVLQKFVALKVLLSGEHSTSEQVERFLREARAASKVEHENLVKVYDLGWTDDRAYFTMELVDGPTLQEILESRGALPLSETLRIGAAIARALHAAHQIGLVHRDVKPANVLLQVDGTPLLADFGLAADLSEEGGKLTRTGQVLGTPTYMAPEQVMGDHKANPRTDQYGLGAVLFECLAGEPPYTGEEAMAVLQDIALGPPPSLRERRPTVPKSVALVVETAMARDPMLRYASALALAEDLDRCRRGQPVNANPPSLRYRLQDAVKRNGRMMALGVGSGALLLAALQLTAMAVSTLDDRVEQKRALRASVELDALRTEISSLESAGRYGAASARLLAFSEQPSARNTPAEADALLMRASLLGKAIEAEPGAYDLGTAWADAYLAAQDPERSALALRGLAGHLRSLAGASRDGRRQLSLTDALQQLTSIDPNASSDPEVQRWQAEALAASGSWQQAARALQGAQGGASKLLGALAFAKQVPEIENSSIAVSSRDGREDLILFSEDSLVRLDPTTLATRERYAFPEPIVPSQTHLVEASIGGEIREVIVAGFSQEDGKSGVRVYTLGSRGLSLSLAWEDGAVLSAAAADLDRDGDDELWVGIGPYGRHLVRLAPDSQGGWRRAESVESIDSAWSDVTSLAKVDIDKDGEDELLVTLAAWGGYDVRAVYSSPTGPVVRARKKMGHLSNLRPRGDGSFWVAKSDLAPSRVMFPSSSPYGDPAGIYRLSIHDQNVDVEQFLGAPPWGGNKPPAIHNLIVSDLDGDAVPDLAYSLVGEKRSAMILVPGADEAQGPLMIPGVAPIAALQADDDPQRELLVSLGPGEGTFLLGAGAGELPKQIVSQIPSAPVIGGSPDLKHRWQRVESLVRMGLIEIAQGEMVKLAEQDTAPPQMRERAAQLADLAGEDARAALLYRRAADELSDPALRRLAAKSFLKAHAFAEAASSWQDPGRPEFTALRRLLEESRTERWTLDRLMPSTIEIHDPSSVVMDPRAQGLRTMVLSDDGDVLSIPFHWSGERLGLDVTLELQRLEWASSIRFELRHPESSLSVGLSGRGGGMLLERTTLCEASFGDHVYESSKRSSPDQVVPVTLSIDFSRVTGDIRCSGRIGEESFHDNLVATKLPPSGDWQLVIGSSGAGSVEGALASAVIQEIALHGTGLSLGAPDPDLSWGSLLASGVLPEAAPEGMGVWYAVALANAGRDEEAATALQAATREGSQIDAEREIAHGLRNHLATFGPVVQTIWPDRYHALFERAYNTAITAHPDDEALMRALINGLPATLDARISRKLGRDRAARLLAARGRAWAALGQPAAARRDLTSATRMGSSDREPRGPVSSAWVGLAALAAVDGDTERAIDAISQALSASASPELTADMVRITPELAPYRETWSTLLP